MEKTTEQDLVIGPLEPTECPICKERVQGLTTVWAGDAGEAFKGCQKCFDEEAEKSPLTQALWDIVKARDEQLGDLGMEILRRKNETVSLLDLIHKTNIDGIRKVLQVATELPEPWGEHAVEAHGRLCELRDVVKDLRKDLLE